MRKRAIRVYLWASAALICSTAVCAGTYSVCVDAGSCHICRFYDRYDDSYQGAITWGCS